ncbi:MAG: FtsQ-type POTRA domain-containing protein [Pseudonocardia sp.]|nr:FtsQ-type POTRA domain-containing protein [Pseudonocardia sp.]
MTRSGQARTGRTRSGRNTSDRSRTDRAGTDRARTASWDRTAGERAGLSASSAARIRLRRALAALVAIVVLLAVLAVGGWALLYKAGLADVETVEVSGVLPAAIPQVTEAAAVEIGAPLASVDTATVAQRVAQLPDVASVEVSRNWPHTVGITVVERQAVALAQTPQGLTLVDAAGVPYHQAPAVPPALPRFTFGAVGPDDESTRAALAVLAALPDQLRGQVVTVDVTAGINGEDPTVQLGLTEGRRVTWGTADDGARKAAVLVPLLTETGTVYDVASPELPTIRR